MTVPVPDHFDFLNTVTGVHIDMIALQGRENPFLEKAVRVVGTSLSFSPSYSNVERATFAIGVGLGVCFRS